MKGDEAEAEVAGSMSCRSVLEFGAHLTVNDDDGAPNDGNGFRPVRAVYQIFRH